jgi:hypothetical protein
VPSHVQFDDIQCLVVRDKAGKIVDHNEGEKSQVSS